MNEVRRKLLAATLAHVPFDGWSERAIRAGAGDVGVDRVTARRAFPGGIADVLALWSAEGDRRMLEELERRDLASMRVRERLATAVRLRLERDRDHREALRLALAHAALPSNAPQAMRALWRTVDAMWRAAGDEATDFNFYTKRGLLAAVYASTLFYWLEDGSEGGAATWAFLDRRISDAMRLPKVIGWLRKFVPEPGRLRRRTRSRRATPGV